MRRRGLLVDNILNAIRKKLATPPGELLMSPDLGEPIPLPPTPKQVVTEDIGSGYKVPYTKILEINPHNNAERLEVATVYGFQVVIQKGKFKVGDKIIYIPIDSILPANVETLLFGPDAKIKLNKQRVRQIKIRGLASQGMVIHPDEISSLVNPSYFKDEQDVGAILGVTKYEPPVREVRSNTNGPKSRKKNPHPMFHSYNGLGNIKWFPNMFKDGDSVVIQEKLHGTNSRASVLPFIANTFWKRVKAYFKIAPATENCYGSNRVEISANSSYKGFYGEDIYGSVFKKLDVFSKLKLGETVFGEIVGPGIQKGYSYGLKEHKFVLFDVKVLEADGTQKWLDPKEVQKFATERGFDFVPVLYEGPFNKEMTYLLTKGASEFNDKSEKIREGLVIKSTIEYSIAGNKQALKWVSEDYLNDPTNTDDH